MLTLLHAICVRKHAYTCPNYRSAGPISFRRSSLSTWLHAVGLRKGLMFPVTGPATQHREREREGQLVLRTSFQDFQVVVTLSVLRVVRTIFAQKFSAAHVNTHSSRAFVSSARSFPCEHIIIGELAGQCVCVSV